MSDTAGVVVIVVGAAGVALTSFVLRRRLPSVVVFGLVSVFSVAVGIGALVVQDHVTTADWIVALTALAVLGPAHVRFLLGPFGPSAGPGTAATDPV
jgi:hypothetical protein